VKDEIRRESHLRTAVRHVREGRAILLKQYELIERLHANRQPTKEAEEVLEWLKGVQMTFEEHHTKLLEDAQERLRMAGYEVPGDDRPRD
jgi:hypothetical protein